MRRYIYKKPYKYFITYNFINEGASGNGRIEIHSKLKIKNFRIIEEIETYIKAINKSDKIVITDYKLIH